MVVDKSCASCVFFSSLVSGILVALLVLFRENIYGLTVGYSFHDYFSEFYGVCFLLFSVTVFSISQLLNTFDFSFMNIMYVSSYSSGVFSLLGLLFGLFFGYYSISDGTYLILICFDSFLRFLISTQLGLFLFRKSMSYKYPEVVE